VTHCPNCRAVVNPTWGGCLACGAPVTDTPPRADFTGPCPADVERIRQTVKTWPQSFSRGWAELVVSAMVAGRDQHEAERIAFQPLAEDALLYQAETREPPGSWPPRPWR